MKYGDFKDLARRTASDKVLRDKAFNIAKNSKYDGYQRDLVCMVYNFFDKKSARLTDKSGKSGSVNMEKNEQLAEEIPKQLLIKLKKKSLFLI